MGVIFVVYIIQGQRMGRLTDILPVSNINFCTFCKTQVHRYTGIVFYIYIFDVLILGYLYLFVMHVRQQFNLFTPPIFFGFFFVLFSAHRTIKSKPN